mgnify:CR=1 FL=1
MDKRIEKYADLLLKCVGADKKRVLFVEIPNYLSDFKDVLVRVSKNYSNIEEVHFEVFDPFKKHDLLLNLDQENINKHPLFDKSIFNKYAKLDAAFLFINSMIPNLMNDIDPEKIKNTALHLRSTQKYFRDLYEGDKLNWCIAGVPNEYWAENALKISNDELWKLLLDVCLVTDDNAPYDDWCKKLDKLEERTNILNNYNFKTLVYKSENGTDFSIDLPDGHLWRSGKEDSGCIVNLPTEEIFTSPQYDSINGVVYASKPLIYNNIEINDIRFVFKDGKVVEFNASSGKDVLEGILTTDEGASYLGEVALVQYDSPISNTGVLFYDTLYDENASCHLALGRAFNHCVKEPKEVLRESGINDSKVHVDFMIGTKDLSIKGITHDGEEIDIFIDGNFAI